MEGIILLSDFLTPFEDKYIKEEFTVIKQRPGCLKIKALA